MKQCTLSTQKIGQTTTRPDASGDSNSIALAPPAYGLDAADQQPIQAVSESEPLASVTWPGWAGVVQRKEASPGTGAPPKNRTGLPDNLKAGIERLSGLALDDVRVHYNSAKPAQLQALAYTQGTQIHVGPGQERHLPHEAWHVVQQKQGRVKPTVQMKGVKVNNDESLEREADVRGAKALRSAFSPAAAIPRLSGLPSNVTPIAPVVQRRMARKKNIGPGELEINFSPDNPTSLNARALEKGYIAYYPGETSRDSRAIYLEQHVRLTEPDSGQLPDLDQLTLETQKTTIGGDGEKGYYVDQIPHYLRKQLGTSTLKRRLESQTAHFYAYSGADLTVSLASVVQSLDASNDDNVVSAEIGLIPHQVWLLRRWAGWARQQKHLPTGKPVTDEQVRAALLKSVEQFPGDSPREFLRVFGFDPRLVGSARMELNPKLAYTDLSRAEQRETFHETQLTRNNTGWKRGDRSFPATLYDTPGSKRPAKFEFMTAPYDQTNQEYIEGYVEWGFEVDKGGPKGAARIKPGSEKFAIYDILWDDFTATAKEARQKFYAQWTSSSSHVIVNDYKPGQLGVYFVSQGLREFVVKPLLTVRNEIFTHELAKRLGIPQPETYAVPSKSEEGQRYLNAIFQSKFKQEYLRNFAETPPEFFLVMTRVEGETFESVNEKSGSLMPQLYEPTLFLSDLGRIVAFDLFIHYQDRTSLNGIGNLANIFIDTEGNYRAVAIDQRVNIKEETIMGSPVEWIAFIVKDITQGGKERLGYLADNLPKSLKKFYKKKDKAIEALRPHVIAGLKFLSQALDKDVLEEVYKSTEPFASKRDKEGVNLKLLESSLEIIKKGLI